ncbi:MAG: hypothetical protein ABI553_04090 [Chloroflexota bacterium]
MIRFFLLRFLPRRLVPILIALDVIRVIRDWRTRKRPPVAPPPGRRSATVDAANPNAAGSTPPSTWTDRTD